MSTASAHRFEADQSDEILASEVESGCWGLGNTATEAAYGAARAPATCGELAQGAFNGVLAMVTLPIDRFAVANVKLTKGRGRVRGKPNTAKATQAVRQALLTLRRSDLDAQLSLQSPIPRGKGFGSSTADVAAAIGATYAALGLSASPCQIAEIALSIEPSDGVMYPGIALFDHLEGRIARTLGLPPPMQVLALEFIGTIETIAFNKAQRTFGGLHRLDQPVALIEAGLRSCDPALIGRGATECALAHQEVIAKPQLEAAIAIGADAGAVGVNVAHSGTLVGILFADGTDINLRIAWAAAQAQERLVDLVDTHQHRLIGGGIWQQALGGALPE